MESFIGGAEKLSVLLLVALGFILKKAGLVSRRNSDALIRLVYDVFLPASVLFSLLQVQITPKLLVLPAAGFIVALSCYALAFLLKGFFSDRRPTQGSFIIASGATNQALFSYPFFLMYLGTTGLSYVAFYDVGQAVLSFSLAYYVAMRYGEKHVGLGKMAGKMLTFPVLWAFALAFFLNVLGFSYAAQPFMPAIGFLQSFTTPLIMLSLGLFLEPAIKGTRAALGVISIRFAFALAASYVLVSALNLQGLERITVLVASSVPPAMLTLVYSVEEGLDVPFTSSLLSVCILIGLVYTPVLFTLLI